MASTIPVVPNDTALPAKARQTLYWLLFASGVTVGSVEIGYLATGPTDALPDWLKITLAVYAYLSGVLGALAGLNVSGVKPAPPAPATHEI